MGFEDIDIPFIERRLARGLEVRDERARRAAVLVPLIPVGNGFDVLFEARSANLDVQPGEVCLPGGGVEPGEGARDACVRETCEELLIEPARISVIGDMGELAGPRGTAVHVFVGVIDGFVGTFNEAEVASLYRVPLAWFLQNEPAVYTSRLEAHMPDDFPWGLIPGGRSYPFSPRSMETYFYHGTDPIIWGFTARVMALFAETLKGSPQEG